MTLALKFAARSASAPVLGLLVAWGCSDSGTVGEPFGTGGSATSGGKAASSAGNPTTSGGSPTGAGSPPGGGTAASGGSATGGGDATGGGNATGGSGSGGTTPTGGTAGGGGPNTGEFPTACPVSVNEGPVVAFPGAEGYGKAATGGRGGEVYAVTTLSSSGAGSLGDALSKAGRTIVFAVSGTIKGRFDMPDNTTIAGQTAPGDGITIHGQLGLANNVIVRYIRVRFDGEGEGDAIGTRYKKKIILDHVTGSWSTDEVLSVYHNEDVTIQWSMATEACPKTGEEHRFGGIWGNQRSTYHHNLIAHNASRNVRWASGCGDNDYRNNVIYNWGYRNCYGGEANQVNDSRNPPIAYSTINMVANYYKPGPATTAQKSTIAEGSSRNGDADRGSWFVSGNYVAGSPAVTSDNWKGMVAPFIKLDAPWNAMPIVEETAEAAYESVLADVGASRPKRDSIDARIIEEVKSGTATNGSKGGLVTCPADTKLPELKSTDPLPDADKDGLPDKFETLCKLNPNDASDATMAAPDGYTMLEKYLNSIDSL